MFCKYCGTKIDDDARFCCACGKQLVVPAAPQPEPAVPAAEPEPIPAEPEPISQPVYAEPEPISQPVYAEPEPIPQPEYTVVEPAPAEDDLDKPMSALFGGKLLPLIAAMTLGFFKFIDIIRGLVNGTSVISLFSNMVVVGAAVLAVLAIFRILKGKFDLFYAIAMFGLAFSELLLTDGYLWYISMLTMPAFAIAGVHYLLKGKVFNNIIRMIMSFAVWGMGFILMIIFVGMHIPFYTIFSNLMFFGASGLMIFSYSPNK